MDFDVVVIGAGAAGLAAAVTAAEAGRQVILFEAESAVGGSMALSGGVIYAAGTSVQASLGVDDSPERLFHDYMSLNQWALRTGPVRTWATQAAPTFEWLLSLGLDVPARASANSHQPGIRRLGEDVVRRGHVPDGEGYALTQALDQARRGHHVEVVLNTRVQELVVEDGRVVGVVADGIQARAGAVIVTTGGMARNPELLREHHPDFVEIAGEHLYAISGDGSRGDHVGLGRQVDAAVVGQGWGMLLANVSFQELSQWQAGFPPHSRMLVDRSGRRFVNEDATYTPLYNAFKDAGGWAWAVFDEAGRLSLDPGYACWTPDRILAEVEAGRGFAGNNPRDLAARLGVPSDALEATIERWNATLPLGADPDFGRDRTLAASGYNAPPPIATAPFYAVKMLPAQLIQTHAGLEIDEHARVVDRAGRVVPGLWAAGEAGGGVLGPHYVGATALGNALTMGRVAATSASRSLDVSPAS